MHIKIHLHYITTITKKTSAHMFFHTKYLLKYLLVQRVCDLCDLFFRQKKTPFLYGCFLKWWYPQNIPKWSFLVGKPMVVGYHHFRKPDIPKRPWWNSHSAWQPWHSSASAFDSLELNSCSSGRNFRKASLPAGVTGRVKPVRWVKLSQNKCPRLDHGNFKMDNSKNNRFFEKVIQNIFKIAVWVVCFMCLCMDVQFQGYIIGSSPTLQKIKQQPYMFQVQWRSLPNIFLRCC